MIVACMFIRTASLHTIPAGPSCGFRSTFSGLRSAGAALHCTRQHQTRLSRRMLAVLSCKPHVRMPAAVSTIRPTAMHNLATVKVL